MCGIPEFFWIAHNKDTLVVDHLQSRNGFFHWGLDFIGPFQDWELESITSFLNLFYHEGFCSEIVL